MKTWYGVWRKEINEAQGGDWLREVADSDGVIAFQSRAAAERRAASLYGFPTYAQAKKADWCEVRPLGGKS